MFEKIKEIISKDKSKKQTANLIVLLFLGVILVIMSNILLSEDDKNKQLLPSKENESNVVGYSDENTFEDYAHTLESELEEILCQIKGVGNVNVMITLEDTVERVPAFNTTQMNEKTSEKDAQGGVREVAREDSSQQVVTSNNDSLMIIKEVKPEVRGVIVVAEGANDIEVKEKLYSAVKTVLGISGNKVEIYSSK